MSNNINSKVKDRFPTESGFKLTLLATLLGGIIGLAFSVQQTLHPFHHGEKLSQTGVDDLIDMVRGFDFVYVPAVSIWLIYISFFIWCYYKKHAGKT